MASIAACVSITLRGPVRSCRGRRGRRARGQIRARCSISCARAWSSEGDELSEEDKVTVSRARKIERFLSQPFFVGEVFTGLKGIYVPVEESVESFEALATGELDEVPEQAFFNVGGVESVLAKAKTLET